MDKAEGVLYKADGAINLPLVIFLMACLILIDFMTNKQMTEQIFQDLGTEMFILFMTFLGSAGLEILPMFFANSFMKDKRTRRDNMIAAVMGGGFAFLMLMIATLRFSTIDIVFADTILAIDYSETAKYVITAYLTIMPLITSIIAFGISCAVTPERRRQYRVRKADLTLAGRYRELDAERRRLQFLLAMDLNTVEDAHYKAAREKATAKAARLKALGPLKIAAYLGSARHLTDMEEGRQNNVQ